MAPTLLAFHGTLSDVPDIFVHTLAIESNGQSQEGVAIAGVQAWNAAMTAGNGSSLAGNMSDATTYTHVTAATILDLSEGTLAASTRRDFDPAISGTNVAPVPGQVSCAVSWTAGTYANGSPVRGRMYLPGVVTGGANGKYTAATVAAVANAMGVLVTELRNFGLVEPAVWSRKLAALQPITAARVGEIPDTIRSRRNGGAENYVDVVLTT